VLSKVAVFSELVVKPRAGGASSCTALIQLVLRPLSTLPIMPLHRRDSLTGLHCDHEAHPITVVAGEDPTYKFPETQQDRKFVYNFVHDQLQLDGNATRNLATFCTTAMESEVLQLMSECADKNIIDKDEYPQTAAIEERCVHMLADLWNAPDAPTTIGCSTTGSSEAAMLGGLALKWRWRMKMSGAGKSTEQPNLVTGPVQVCWHKFCRYFDVELREVPMEGDRLLLTPEEVTKRCDENTIGVVATFGVTFTLQYEPIKEICDALDRLEKETGLNIPVHVDGASGAFLAPFCDPDLVWDFRLPRVKSINASGHKFGLAPLGVGWALWRERHDLPDDLVFHVNYLGGDMPTFALNFSRPGGEIISQYYNFLRLGKEGYRNIQMRSYQIGQTLAKKIESLGLFNIIHDSTSGIPGLCWELKEPSQHNWDLYDLGAEMRSRGWLIPTYSMPPNRQDLVVQRVLLRFGFSEEMTDSLFQELQSAVEKLNQRPKRLRKENTSSLPHDHSGRPEAARGAEESNKPTTIKHHISKGLFRCPSK
jgi:glutamate decarboxylase